MEGLEIMKITRDMVESAFLRGLHKSELGSKYIGRKMECAMEKYDDLIDEGYNSKEAIEKVTSMIFDRDIEDTIFKDLGFNKNIKGRPNWF